MIVLQALMDCRCRHAVHGHVTTLMFDETGFSA